MEFKKGKIHNIENGGKTARCVPSDNSEIVTLPLVIPYYWRREMGNIQVGEEIYYLEDDGLGGYIIGRTDGEWDYTLRGSMEIEKSLDVKQQLTTPLGEIKTVTSSTITADNITASGKSLAGHSHKDSQGGTTSSPL